MPVTILILLGGSEFGGIWKSQQKSYPKRPGIQTAGGTGVKPQADMAITYPSNYPTWKKLEKKIVEKGNWKHKTQKKIINIKIFNKFDFWFMLCYMMWCDGCFFCLWWMGLGVAGGRVWWLMILWSFMCMWVVLNKRGWMNKTYYFLFALNL